MPTALRFDGLRVVVYPNDHRPAHVHVVGRGHEAVFYLRCARGPVSLRENFGFSRSGIQRIEAKLNQNVAALCRAWETIHGNAQ